MEDVNNSLVRTHQSDLIEDGKTIGKTITIEFGKNGCGLTEEFSEIHKIVSEMSKLGYVYLSNMFIDELDDVYDMTFHLIYADFTVET
jgi:hypothetical protein